MQPINYLLQNKNPVDILFGTLNNYQNYQQNEHTLAQQAEINRLKQAQNERELQAMKEMQDLDFNDQTALRQFLGRYGDLGAVKGVQDYLGKLDEKEKQAMIGETSQAIALLQNGRSDLAVADAKAKAQAYKNAGNSERAGEYEQIAQWIEQDPKSALNHLMMSYAIAVPKDSASSYETLVKTNRPENKTVDVGDGIVSMQYDPITGEARVGESMAKGVSPDAELQSQTSRFVSNNSLKGTMYTADTGLQREQISQQGQNERQEATLNYNKQQEMIKRGAAKTFDGKDGKMYYYTQNADGRLVAFPMLDQNGNHVETMVANQKAKSTEVIKMENDILTTEHQLHNLNRVINNLQNGTLNLGLLSNAVSSGRNSIGMSNEQSLAYAEMKETINAAVNQILMMANGTQTEGDAQRAKAVILASPMRDNKAVLQSLYKLQDLANKTIALKKQQIDRSLGQSGSIQQAPQTNNNQAVIDSYLQ